MMSNWTTTRKLVLFLVLFPLTGCSTWEGVRVDPLNRQRIVSASAYSLDGCQSAMDELAHANVQMVQHTRQLAVSIFSFGYEPAYLCTGTAPLSGSSAAPEVPTHQ
jgi:uncharacterized protein YcfL